MKYYIISHNILKQQPKYAELNWVISLVMSGITASLMLIFCGNINGDLRNNGVNLVAFPRLHFFAIAQAHLFAPDQEITDQMSSSRNSWQMLNQKMVNIYQHLVDIVVI